MRRNANRLVISTLGALIGCATTTAPAAELLIENATIISAEQSQPLINHYVHIRDERIVYVGNRPPKLDHSVPRIDGKGKFVTPGLMDSHVHLSSTPGMDMVDDPSLGSLRQAYRRQQPRSYLYFGVTQLLDLTSDPDAIAFFNMQPLHPDVVRCGAAPVLDGYPAVLAPKPDRYRILPDYIVEPANREPLPSGADQKAHTPEVIVSSIAATGAKCIKIFLEDGFGPASHWPMLSPATVDRIREAAHSRGLLVVAHANALDMQSIAVAGRVDVLAHGLWNWPGGSEQGRVPPAVADHLRKVHELGIGWQATLRVMAGIREVFVPGTLDDPVYAKVVPGELLAWYRTDGSQAFKRETKKDFGGDVPDAVVARVLGQGSERGMLATKFLLDLGHPLLLGSDTPSSPTYGNQPGYDTYREMGLLAKAGIPLRAIFEAATINNTRQFRLDQDYGTVQQGKIANLLLLGANPLESVEAWNRIEKVILRGRALDREALAVATKSP